MQAIHTKYIPATNTRGSRIKAYTGSGFSVTIPYDYSLNDVELHFKAVKALIARHYLDWSTNGMRYGGSADGKGYSFCFDHSKVTA
jgi:hypothetical protein